MEIPLIDAKYLLEKFPGKGGWTYASIPEVLQRKDTPFGWVRVRGFIDSYTLNPCKLMPMGNGTLFLPVKVSIRKIIHKQEGDWVHIILYENLIPSTIPEELIECFKSEPNAYTSFLQHPEPKQMAIVAWIYDAQNEPEKIRRILQTIDKLVTK